MAIYDRWFRGEGRNKPRSAEHGCEKRWQVRWRDHAGVQRKKAFARKIDAEQFDAKIRTQLADGSYVDPSAGSVSFRMYAEQWRQARTHDLPTSERIEAEFRRHAYSAEGTSGKTVTGGPSLGDYQLRMLARRPSILQAWIAGLRLQPNSARKVVGDVSQVFRAAVADGLIPANPLASDRSGRSVIQKPKAVHDEAVPWAGREVAAVADALPGHLQALPLLAAATGLRQGETFGLAVGDVDFLRRVVHVDTQVRIVGCRHVFAPTKNSKTRDVPIPGPLLPILAEHIRSYPPVEVTLPWATPDGKAVTRTLVFANAAHGVLDRHGFNHLWRRAWRAVGIPDRGGKNGMHVLRHTAASTWLSHGLSLAKTAAYLGDTQEVILRTYSHFLPGDEDRARAIMDDWMTGALDSGETASAPDVPQAAR